MDEVRAKVEAQAPVHVLEALRWLEQNGYRLSGSQDGGMGLSLSYSGACEVLVIRDRSQWTIDIAPAPGAEFYSYDLLRPAASGTDYRLPAGDESWLATLPGVLEWIHGPGVAAAIDRLKDQRYVLMWPDSRTAADIRRRWKRDRTG